MKGLLVFGLVGTSAMALAVDPVSVFEFNGDLAPSPGSSSNAKTMDYYRGSGVTFEPVGSSVVFEAQTVGSVSKLVAKFNQGETFRAFHGIGKNGGGDYGNIYTILMDVKLNQQVWAGLYNTNENHNNDSELFIQDGVGIGNFGDYAGSFGFGEWQRVVTTVDLTQGFMKVYLNGSLANEVAISGIDGRFALYTWDDPYPEDLYDNVLIFGDDTLEESASGFVSQLAFWDVALTGEEVGALGPVGQPVPEPATIAGIAAGLAFLGARRRRR